MAKNVKTRHIKALNSKEIFTKYIQFDEMESFEHTREKPLGIQLSIRPKTGQILSAKVCRIPIKALTLSPKKKAEYKKSVDRETSFKKMLYVVVRQSTPCLHGGE